MALQPAELHPHEPASLAPRRRTLRPLHEALDDLLMELAETRELLGDLAVLEEHGLIEQVRGLELRYALARGA